MIRLLFWIVALSAAVALGITIAPIVLEVIGYALLLGIGLPLHWAGLL